MKVYGANYLYVHWHKPVVYDNFDEQMQHMPIYRVSQGDIQIFKVHKGYKESINEFHRGSSLERERERERIIMYGKYPGQYTDCMIYSDQTVRKYSRHVI